SVADTEETTTLKKGEPYRESYTKENSYFSVSMPKSHTDFIDDFLEETGFPSGYYVTKGAAEFSTDSDSYAQDESNINLEANVDFKVLEESRSKVKQVKVNVHLRNTSLIKDRA